MPGSTTILREGALARARERTAAVPLLVWCLAAVGLFSALQAVLDPSRFTGAFFDADDATRMIEVRDFLAGGSWFDTTLARVGAPAPLVSHWSRLIDLPIAMLVLFFGVILAPAEAELAARVAWPLMLFVALLWVLARAAEARGGRTAAFVALALAVLCLSGTVQFAPGRIDHHNALILALVGGVVFLAASFANARAGWIAGAALGVGTAIGLEALPLTVAALGAAALLATVTGRGRAGVERAAAAFTGVLGAAFLVTTAPGRWLDVRCDALSLNLVLLAIVAGAGVVAAMRVAGALWMRLAILGVAGLAGLAAYGAAEPACLAGPFGQVDPAVWPIWLSHVSETNGILWLARTLPAAALAYAVHVALGLAAAALLLKRERDDGTILYAAVLAMAVLASLWQAKLMPYAAFLAVPPLAVAIARLAPSAHVSAATKRVAAVVVVNQVTLLAVAAMLLGASNPAGARFAENVAAKRACLAKDAIAPLAALPPGLIVSEIDLGPFIVAGTAHRVLSGPYHRLDKAILATQAILYGPEPVARASLKALGATYVVLCPGLAATNLVQAPAPDALKPALLAGRVPDFLEPVALAGTTPLEVWRVR